MDCYDVWVHVSEHCSPAVLVALTHTSKLLRLAALSQLAVATFSLCTEAVYEDAPCQYAAGAKLGYSVSTAQLIQAASCGATKMVLYLLEHYRHSEQVYNRLLGRVIQASLLADKLDVLSALQESAAPISNAAVTSIVYRSYEGRDFASSYLPRVTATECASFALLLVRRPLSYLQQWRTLIINRASDSLSFLIRLAARYGLRDFLLFAQEERLPVQVSMLYEAEAETFFSVFPQLKACFQLRIDMRNIDTVASYYQAESREVLLTTDHSVLLFRNDSEAFLRSILPFNAFRNALCRDDVDYLSDWESRGWALASSDACELEVLQFDSLKCCEWLLQRNHIFKIDNQSALERACTLGCDEIFSMVIIERLEVLPAILISRLLAACIHRRAYQLIELYTGPLTISQAVLELEDLELIERLLVRGSRFARECYFPYSRQMTNIQIIRLCIAHNKRYGVPVIARSIRDLVLLLAAVPGEYIGEVASALQIPINSTTVICAVSMLEHALFHRLCALCEPSELRKVHATMRAFGAASGKVSSDRRE